MGPGPAIPAAWGLLKRPVPGLETVTLKTAEDGAGLILRLREPAGRRGRQTLRFRLPDETRTPRLFLCTLLEEEKEPLTVQRGRDSVSVTITVRPFEVVTLKLQI